MTPGSVGGQQEIRSKNAGQNESKLYNKIFHRKNVFIVCMNVLQYLPFAPNDDRLFNDVHESAICLADGIKAK